MIMTNTCTYIGTGPPCTQPALLGRSYCADHLWMVYKQGSAKARKKDQRRAEQVWNIQDAFNEAITELEAEGFDCYVDSERLQA